MAEFADKTEIEEFEEYFQGVERVLGAFHQKYLYDPIFQRGIDQTRIFESLRTIRGKINGILPGHESGSSGFKIQQR